MKALRFTAAAPHALRQPAAAQALAANDNAPARAAGRTRAVLLGAALSVAILTAVCAPAAANESVQVRLFGSAERDRGDIAAFPKWTRMLQRYAQERHLEDAPCSQIQCPLQEWKAFLMGLHAKDRMRQLQAVNAYVNRTPYQTDASRYGSNDYWATPREFLGRSGDCEDYAIAKYLSLRKLGWSASELRIVIVKDEHRGELHAVLIAYHQGTAYVLDNLSESVREHAAIRNYRPLLSINEVTWHQHFVPGMVHRGPAGAEYDPALDPDLITN